MEKIKKILITGSSGTIGNELFKKLLEKNYQVFGFDKKINAWQPELNKLSIKGNLLSKKDIKRLPKDFDLIIHLAANARVYDLVLQPKLALENAMSTFNILEFARQNSIKNFMFASSREVYGNKKIILSAEKNIDPELCESAYSASKISGEAFVRAFFKCYGINYIIFRFSNVYGKYDQSNRFVPLMLKKMAKNQPIEIFGKEKLLDFTYIEDCVGGIIRAVDNFYNVKNNVFNIASGQGEKLIKVAQILKEQLKSQSKIILKESRPGEVTQYVADISKAKKLLGYKPKYHIEKGLNLTINWYQKNGNDY